MTITDFLIKTTQTLTLSATPRLDAELMLNHVLKVKSAYLHSHSQQALMLSQEQELNKLILRRQRGEPMAYLLGEWEFWSLTLKVTPATLIPRPETELLVETCLDVLPRDEKLSVLDVGTGSGAIALALAYERPDWQIMGTDSSAEALSVAIFNVERLALKNITFIESDLFSALTGKKFHAIVSNPPYIAPDDPHLAALRFEPESALVAEQSGLAVLAKLIKEAPNMLEMGGYLLLEHGYDQGSSVRNMLRGSGGLNIKTFKDLAGIERVTVGQFSV